MKTPAPEAAIRVGYVEIADGRWTKDPNGQKQPCKPRSESDVNGDGSAGDPLPCAKAEGQSDHFLTDKLLVVSFFIPGEAIGLGRQRTRIITPKGAGKAFVHNYKPPKSANYENKISILAKQAMCAGGLELAREAVRVDFIVHVLRPKGHYRSGKNAHLLRANAPVFVITKPDLDNVEKALLDGMNKIVYADDKQVCVLHKKKIYAEDAGVEIQIRGLE